MSDWEVEAGREVITRSKDVEYVFFLGVTVSVLQYKGIVVRMFSFLLQVSCSFLFLDCDNLSFHMPWYVLFIAIRVSVPG